MNVLTKASIIRIEKAIDNIRKAEELALDCIKAEMVKIATVDRIDRMDFTTFSTVYYRGSAEVENARLDALENIYLERISKWGFTAHWENDKGWLYD